MSLRYLSKTIPVMHEKLNKIIEANDYNLMCDEVQEYSRKLDRVLLLYIKYGLNNRAPCPAHSHKEIQLGEEAI